MIMSLRANTYSTELQQVVELGATLLEGLANLEDAPSSEEALEGLAAGAGSLWPSLAKQLDALFEVTTPDDRRSICDAYKNDITFEQEANSADFAFMFPGLDDAIRKPASKLLGQFYEVLTGTGFTVRASDGSLTKLDRTRLEAGFFASNAITACPACLKVNVAPGRSRATRTSYDHYLPKFMYGPLAFHPYNLVFVCPRCNDRLKGQRDPVTQGNQGTTSARTSKGILRTACYLPYRDSAADDIDLTFDASTVKLSARTADAAPKVETMDRLFDLSNEWSDALPTHLQELFNFLQGEPSPTTITAVLDRAINAASGPIEAQVYGTYLRGQYAKHLKAERLASLETEWKRQHEERERSRSNRDAR